MTGEKVQVRGNYVLREPVEDGNNIFAWVQPNGSISIDQYVIEEGGHHLTNFLAEVPINRDFSENDSPRGINAFDWRSGKIQTFFPTREPKNIDVQRGYARVVQDGVKDILKVVKLPVKIPFKLDQ